MYKLSCSLSLQSVCNERVGRDEGTPVGELDGRKVGWRLGRGVLGTPNIRGELVVGDKVEGANVGGTEGIPDGATEGWPDGCEDGLRTGWLEGSREGWPEGTLVGRKIGWEEGRADG